MTAGKVLTATSIAVIFSKMTSNFVKIFYPFYHSADRKGFKNFYDNAKGFYRINVYTKLYEILLFTFQHTNFQHTNALLIGSSRRFTSPVYSWYFLFCSAFSGTDIKIFEIFRSRSELKDNYEKKLREKRKQDN